jgi:hypothetical protein
MGEDHSNERQFDDNNRNNNFRSHEKRNNINININNDNNCRHTAICGGAFVIDAHARHAYRLLLLCRCIASTRFPTDQCAATATAAIIIAKAPTDC